MSLLDMTRLVPVQHTAADRTPRTLHLLELGVGLGAAACILLFVVVALLRIGHPFELEWQEGAMVDQVGRILDGKPLYAVPSLEFTPAIYAPLYFYVAAGLASVLGLGFLPLRLVSFLASLTCCALLFAFVKRETGRRVPALIAAALFAASFRRTGAWLDVARVDALFLTLALGGAFVVRFGRSWTAASAAGVLFALAFLTKQTAVVIFVPLLVWALRVDLRLGLASASSLVLVVIIADVGFYLASDGWYHFYVYELPAAHGWDLGASRGFWRHIVTNLPLALVLGVAWLGSSVATGDRRRRSYYLVLVAVGLAASWFQCLHTGAWDNVLLPAYAVAALLFGLALGEFARRAEGSGARIGSLVAALLLSSCALQFWLLRYRPDKLIPTRADVRAGRALVRVLEKIPGDVLVLDHGYLARPAGKPPTIHRGAFYDVIRGARGSIAHDLEQALARAFRERTYGAVVLDAPLLPALDRVLLESYAPTAPPFRTDDVFYPVTGVRIRPLAIFRPR